MYIHNITISDPHCVPYVSIQAWTKYWKHWTIYEYNYLFWLHWKNISWEYLSLFFFCLHYVVSVSMHYGLCLVTVRMKVLQNGR